MTLQFRKPNPFAAGVLAISLACSGALVLDAGVAGAGGYTYTGGQIHTGSNSETFPISKVQDLSGSALQGTATVGNSSVDYSAPAGTFSSGEQLVVADSSGYPPPNGTLNVASVFFGVYNSDGTKVTGTFSNPITVTIKSSSIKKGDEIQEFVNGSWTDLGTATEDGTATITIASDPVIAITAVKKSTGSKTSSISTSKPLLALGSRIAAVKTLQTILNGDGATLVVDGVFGPKTLAAVKAFQRAHDLVVDGIVGPLTWKVLLS